MPLRKPPGLSRIQTSVSDDDEESARRERRAREHDELEAAVAASALDLTATSAAQKVQDFEYSAPMLVMPLAVLKAQGSISKSTLAWREEAFAKGWLVEHQEDLICIFVSHRWWDCPPGRTSFCRT